MPIGIELRDRVTGEVLGAAEESWDSIRSMWPALPADEYPLLAGVDRDDDTTFNRLQLPRLVAELERLRPDAHEDVRPVVERVLELARRGASASQAQLWFLGD